ncbi:MOSC domain-containing protein [Marinobacter hydrocarbonoclasticus]|nr:MOSC domain-containing protein [Marinobacter nauticus]
MATSLSGLTNTLPQRGHLQWIGLRPARHAPMVAVERAEVTLETGLIGDHFSGRPGGRRQVTLIQAEHLDVLAQLLGHPVEPAQLRRNLVVAGINLLALRNQRFRVGNVELEGTLPCAPCSRMEAALGPGGFNAMRGHGGLCARVLQGGTLTVGDPVSLIVNAL